MESFVYKNILLIYAEVVLKHFDVSWGCIDVGSAVALDIHVLCCIVLEICVFCDRIESKSVFMRSLYWIGVLYFIKQGSPTIIPVRIILHLDKNQTCLPLLGKAAK
mmetsp:Transcript_6715/g.10036  ORF Transcript_6715/g.10036 Transcript_6715/m.10036 type:complete len:106 (-) Transcript_6715:27-344(-)